MNEVIWQIVGYFGSALAGSGVGYIFTRNKYKAEVESAKINNFDKSLDAYKKMYEDMIADLKGQNQELVEQKEELKGEISSLKDELTETRKQVLTLTNFVLASAIQRADGGKENALTPESIEILKAIVNSGKTKK